MTALEDALRQAIEAVSVAHRESRGDGWLADGSVDIQRILEAVTVESAPRDDVLDLVVARYGRTGPSVSIKPSNVGREISRTLHAGALFGLGEAMALTGAEPLRIATALVAMVFASHYAARAPVGYNDACVLDAAWRLALHRQSRTFRRDEIVDARQEIADRYDAPKCANPSDIEEALRNLAGLRAIEKTNGGYLLKEKIIFFKDGRIWS